MWIYCRSEWQSLKPLYRNTFQNIISEHINFITYCAQLTFNSRILSKSNLIKMKQSSGRKTSSIYSDTLWIESDHRVIKTFQLIVEIWNHHYISLDEVSAPHIFVGLSQVHFSIFLWSFTWKGKEFEIFHDFSPDYNVTWNPIFHWQCVTFWLEVWYIP